MNGSYPYEGRLEIYLTDSWKTVCDDSLSYYPGNQLANVVCGQLGYLREGINYISNIITHINDGFHH